MTAFKQLKDVSTNFEEQLRSISTGLFAAKVGDAFEEGIAKRLKDLTLLTSKLRLLRANPLSATPQIIEKPKEDTIKEFADTAQWKVLEQCIVKSTTQAHAVKALITTPDENLDVDMIYRKKKIIDLLKDYSQKDTELRQLEHLQREKDEELAALRAQWDGELAQLRDAKERGRQRVSNAGEPDPMYKKLQLHVNKLEMMRWLIARIMVSRSSRDWLATPERTAQLLKLARKHNTVEMFLEN